MPVVLDFPPGFLQLDGPPLSPLPVSRKQPHSPRKVSSQHKVFISPIKPGTCYFFCRVT